MKIFTLLSILFLTHSLKTSANDSLSYESFLKEIESYEAEIVEMTDGLNFRTFSELAGPIHQKYERFSNAPDAMSVAEKKQLLGDIGDLLIKYPPIPLSNLERLRQIRASNQEKMIEHGFTTRRRPNGSPSGKLYQYKTLRDRMAMSYGTLSSSIFQKDFLSDDGFSLDSFLESKLASDSDCKLTPIEVTSFRGTGGTLMPKLLRGSIQPKVYFFFEPYHNPKARKNLYIPTFLWISTIDDAQEKFNSLMDSNLPSNSCENEVSKQSDELRYVNSAPIKKFSGLEASSTINWTTNICGSFDYPCMSTTHCCTCSESFKKPLINGKAELVASFDFGYEAKSLNMYFNLWLRRPGGTSRVHRFGKTYPTRFSSLQQKAESFAAKYGLEDVSLKSMGLYKAAENDRLYALTFLNSASHKRLGSACYLHRALQEGQQNHL